MQHRFVVTPWRDSEELLQLRRQLYWRPESGDEDKREAAVTKILAWKIRKNEIPLLLESTADLVDAVVRDEEGGLPQQSVKMLYATAIARFATGISDTSTELRRSRPSWLPSHLQSSFLDFPTHILETRHSIVHRHLPTLAELKRTAKECLDWLWEWYWSQLDNALAVQKPSAAGDSADTTALRTALQTLLKTYVRDRKIEIKGHKKPSKAAASSTSRAATTACTAYLDIRGTSTPDHDILVTLLVKDKMIVPNDKKLGSTMSGAFLIWTPFLAALASSTASFLARLNDQLFDAMNAPLQSQNFLQDIEADPVREAMCEWLGHLATSKEWTDARSRKQQAERVEHIMQRCFADPTYWNLRLAESILSRGDVEKGGMWRALLAAAKDEDMDVDGAGDAEGIIVEEDIQMQLGEAERSIATGTKQCGPRKVVGLWRPKPIGFVPEGWEDDG